MKKIEKILLFLLVFFFPSQLAYHFWPKFAYLFGIRVDYLAPTVYLTDILIFLLILFSFNRLKKIEWRQKVPVLVLVGVYAFFNVYLAKSHLLAMLKWLTFIKLALFGIYLYLCNLRGLKKLIISALSLSVAIFSLIGIGQFLIKSTIGGPLYYLGERHFSVNTPGMALTTLFGKEYLRAYSTFPHPNALAGYLAVAVLIIVTLRGEKNFFKKASGWLLLLLASLCFILTFSTGAFVALAVVLIMRATWLLFAKQAKKLILLIYFISIGISFLLPVVNISPLSGTALFRKNLRDRFYLAEISAKLFSQNPLYGKGMNNFIPVAAKSFSLNRTVFAQPVHNLFLLIMAEGGIIGLVFLFYLFFLAINKGKPLLLSLAFLFIIITGIGDHYWLTLQQNQLLLVFLFGISFKK